MTADGSQGWRWRLYEPDTCHQSNPSSAVFQQGLQDREVREILVMWLARKFEMADFIRWLNMDFNT